MLFPTAARVVVVVSLVPTRVWRASGLAMPSVCTRIVTRRSSAASTVALGASRALAKAVSVSLPTGRHSRQVAVVSGEVVSKLRVSILRQPLHLTRRLVLGQCIPVVMQQRGPDMFCKEIGGQVDLRGYGVESVQK